ncbi:MAG TPA: hypothetical protein H9736_07250, partial [Candidatus Anaerotruncus excrementipullorum]|nr:hypothetical protein [Candidatus Anaerotruncus excrementipullorum]
QSLPKVPLYHCFCGPRPDFHPAVCSAKRTRDRVPFLAVPVMPLYPAMLLRVQTENALFEFTGQQKSVGLVVDETNKPTHCILCIFFSNFCALAVFK